MKPSTIAIDGPSASGKSTVGELLAKRLGYLYFDTGVMYRALTYQAMQRHLDLKDEYSVSRMARLLKIDVLSPTVPDGRQNTVCVDGTDITLQLRDVEIDANVSTVSLYPAVREAMVRQQREIGRRGRVVMIGRDIGTVVLPEADLKIYLTARVEERARRRYREHLLRGDGTSYEHVLDLMRRRDAMDSARKESPMRPADDAHIIETDDMTILQVVEAIEEFWT